MEMARAIIVNVLHRDLAYGNRLIALARAEELAAQVMQRFVQGGTRYLHQRRVQARRGGRAGAVALGSGDHVELRHRRAHPGRQRIRLRLGRRRRLNAAYPSRNDSLSRFAG